MKKKQFYTNEQRDKKWTEEQTGRKIEFANKYLYHGTYSDKFDNKRPKETNTVIEKEKASIKKKKIIISILCVVLISVGYLGMQIYMELAALPAKRLNNIESQNTNDLANSTIALKSKHIESVGLDGGVMLTSIISEAQQNGYSSITFDAKRNDGTIGYTSKLASVDTYRAISSPATELEASIKQLNADDILPVARVCCYQDNVVPVASNNYALKVNGQIYKDKQGNTYLDTNSEFAYNYVKDIIAELHNLGINVFILYGCDLPEGIADGEYGFEILKAKLNAELGNQIKFIEEKNVSLNGLDETNKLNEELVKNEIQKFSDIDYNTQTYIITTKLDDKTVNEQLINNGITSFVITE